MITLIPVFIASCRATEDKFVRIMPQKVVPHGSNPHRQTVKSFDLESCSDLPPLYVIDNKLSDNMQEACEPGGYRDEVATRFR